MDVTMKLLSRRRFLQVGGVGLACVAAPRSAVADRTQMPPSGAPLLVTIFLRGGADGLHLVPPTGDRGYAKLRGALALTEAIPFAQPFALHPELSALAPLVARGQLAVVHAAGSPAATRSHFEAQDAMELGVADSLALPEGWLTRALSGHGKRDPFASLAITASQPLSLRGSGAFAIGDPERFGLPGASGRARAAVEASYRAGSDAVSAAGTQALASLSQYERAMGTGTAFGRRLARRGRTRERSLRDAVDQLLALDRAGLGVRAAFLESDGWDTHFDQGTGTGRMARAIRDLGDGLAALADGLGEQRDWLVVVMTEFGRTVRPNGSRGSDHGHGSVVLALGPSVRGGVYGDWAGLAADRLYEGRDLPVLTDWRSVLWEVLWAHLGETPPADTFPGFVPSSLGLLRGA